MKELKNDSGIYTEQIVSAITDCYSKTEPSNGELMKLYAFIGQNICEQGEKAFHDFGIPKQASHLLKNTLTE